MSESIRIDKWLWFARFFKSRSLATKLVQGNRVRINREVIAKASATVKAGDVLTFPQAREIRVIKVLALGERRGPASEAQGLYEDLEPPKPKSAEEKAVAVSGRREFGAARPTKADRRALDRLRGSGD